MADILFVTVDGGGNVPPLLGVAREVAHAGHRVRVLGQGRLRPEVERYGLTLSPYRNTRAWDSTRQQSGLRWVPMLNDRSIFDAVAAACAGDAPDVAVVDCMIPPAHAAVDQAGIPRVVLTHTYKAYMDGLHRLTLGAAARTYGYNTVRLWDSAPVNLVTTLRELDPAAARRHAPNVRWSGVVDAGGSAQSGASGPPLVLVSLSSNGFRGQLHTLRRIVAALGSMSVRAIVTTGGVIDPSDLRSPGNVEIVGYADHLDILPRCSLLIGHGGHSTTVRALAHGVPVLALPASPMTDQRMVARSVAAAGAGAALSRFSSARAIRRAAETLLRDPGCREGAARLGAAVRGSNGAVNAAQAILELAD
ncbi:glycosyltransferase [Tsukamurella sp. 8F]|uniref:glycosyltransferase n=1 Tax=unclassified Tsukamurella TaxID=2633480 RepID=UPI0023B9BD1B|nr:MULTISPECIES: glycosyltransferase [unclassified Tsukamurella]MDF0532490.1 glycosyltransferase [Tsukamurella sp. 8J]MDF0589161.1 glycosyltransferase [Tsukamurella sp. 8F]